MRRTIEEYEPTPKQFLLMQCVRDFIRETGDILPTCTELAMLMANPDLQYAPTRQAVRRYVDALRRKGYLKDYQGLQRSIVLTDKGAEYLARKEAEYDGVN